VDALPILTSLFLAKLPHIMEMAMAQRYSVNELLQLRQDGGGGVLQKIKEHPEALNNITNNTNSYRSLGRKNLSLRFTRSSEDSGTMRSVNSTNSAYESRQLQWHFRHRDSSDYSDQPRSAPSGIAAQQSENFQRFYKAVISPTHVRVTAGGRIVPNTRAIAPPKFNWDANKLAFEPASMPDMESNNSQQELQTISNLPQNMWSQPTTILPLYNEHPQTMALQLQSSAADNQDSVENVDPVKMNQDTPTDLLGPGSLHLPIKISHPSQFDHTKPFMYNGHVVYPAPSGFQPTTPLPLPYTVLGNTSFMPQHAIPPPGFLPTQLPVSMSPLFNSFMMAPAAQNPTLQPLDSLQPSSSPYMPASSTTLLVSDITKQQIQSLRLHLKHLDNQIANNRHQIDEAHMTNQRNVVISSIEKMQAMLEAQLASEADISTSMQWGQASGTSSALAQHFNALQKEKSKEEATNNQPLFVKPQSVRVHMTPATASSKTAAVKTEPVKSATTKTVTTANISSKMEAVKGNESTFIAKQSPRSEPVAKSRLSAAAAMAPAFQPRAQTSNTPKTDFGVPLTSYRPAFSHLSTQSSSAWSHEGSLDTESGFGYGVIPKMGTIQEALSQPQMYAQTFHGLPTSLNSMTLLPANSVPYLVGTLPKGIRAHDATSKDLVYERELTEAELRARELYWGKAPRCGTTGLPKYDGKDFYPPSPKKETYRPVSNPLTGTPNIKRTPTPIDLENLFDEPSKVSRNTGSPVRMTSPVRSRPGLENIITTPIRSRPGLENIITPAVRTTVGTPRFSASTATQAFLETGVIGFRSPSPRPSQYTFEASREEDWPPIGPPRGYKAATSPSFTIDALKTPGAEDFSHLFLRRGDPGYMSPTPPHQGTGRVTFLTNSPGMYSICSKLYIFLLLKTDHSCFVKIHTPLQQEVVKL
jgi:hypothetical protein